MPGRIAAVTLLVDDYETAIPYFVDTLGFEVTVDTPRPNGGRWVVVAPGGAPAAGLRLVEARDAGDRAAIGRQAGGRVFLVLETDDLAHDHARLSQKGVVFLEPPRRETYGRVAVFVDRFGNRWDLIEPSHPA